MATNLLSRQQFLLQLQRFCDAAKSNDEVLGLLVFDLVEFHRVNAVYGFDIGDQVLEAVPKLVENAAFRHSSVFRIGSDEFALVLNQVTEPKLLTLAANKLVRVFSDPFRLDDRMLRIEPVVGIAAAEGESLQAQRLLIAAERNAQEARKQNQRFLTFNPDEEMQAVDWRFESRLHQALALNELSLFYQPKIHLKTGLPTHAEALSRWVSPDYGTIGPIDFIPILEKTGGIEDLTNWAIHTALRELNDWAISDTNHQSSVAVNVSSAVLDNPEFPELVQSALSIWGTDPQRLTLEVTEGTLVQEEHSSYQSLYRLKDLGLKISIDDFGTGYSCLSYFKQLPADELKIDQSFVKNIQQDKDDEHLTRVIIDLAHRFNMSVVAEGVEDQATYLKLKEYGCDYVQGYYFSRPLPQDKYCEWLKGFKSENYE